MGPAGTSPCRARLPRTVRHRPADARPPPRGGARRRSPAANTALADDVWTTVTGLRQTGVGISPGLRGGQGRELVGKAPACDVMSVPVRDSTGAIEEMSHFASQQNDKNAPC